MLLLGVIPGDGLGLVYWVDAFGSRVTFLAPDGP